MKNPPASSQNSSRSPQNSSTPSQNSSKNLPNTTDNCCKNYNDIINLSRPESSRPKASPEARAAQFAPFAALTGYEALVQDATDRTIIEAEPEIDIDPEFEIDPGPSNYEF